MRHRIITILLACFLMSSFGGCLFPTDLEEYVVAKAGDDYDLAVRVDFGDLEIVDRFYERTEVGPETFSALQVKVCEANKITCAKSEDEIARVDGFMDIGDSLFVRMGNRCQCSSGWSNCELDINESGRYANISACDISELAGGEKLFRLVLVLEDSGQYYGLDISPIISVERVTVEDNTPYVDSDDDGTPDNEDNCPIANEDQADSDGDGFGDACDTCVEFSNPSQTVCEGELCADSDSDGVTDCEDLCIGLYDTTNSSNACFNFNTIGGFEPSDGSGQKKSGCSLIPEASFDVAAILLLLVGFILIGMRRKSVKVLLVVLLMSLPFRYAVAAGSGSFTIDTSDDKYVMVFESGSNNSHVSWDRYDIWMCPTRYFWSIGDICAGNAYNSEGELYCADSRHLSTEICRCYSDKTDCELEFNLAENVDYIRCDVTNYVREDEDFVFGMFFDAVPAISDSDNTKGYISLGYKNITPAMITGAVAAAANAGFYDTEGDAVGDDADDDGIPDDEDFCPEKPNTDNLDSDQDGVGDACDNCPQFANPDQLDIERIQCLDTDGDGIPNFADLCPTMRDSTNSSDECVNFDLIDPGYSGSGSKSCSLLVSSMMDFFDILPLLTGILIFTARRKFETHIKRGRV